MSNAELLSVEEKYLFTFQDETQLWISKEFIKKYQQLPFHDIIKHSEKYDDGSYYIDMLPFHIERVISFLMADNMDIFSLNLKDSYDIYKTLIEYSVKIDKEIQSDLLYHVKELFYKYLKDNNYDVYVYINCIIKECMPIELFNLEKKEICFNGLLTPKRKDELLYYALLIKMMNITKVKITYNYASNIPIEYICPSCIKDIFHSLEKLEINVTTHYNKTELLLNPNSDEYIIEYNRLFNEYDYEIINPEEYEYYAESEMNEYNKISSSLDRNKLYYSRDLINSYNKRRNKNELPKLYKYIVNEAIYTNDYSKVEINKTKDEYELDDIIRIEYDQKTNDKRFIIHEVSSEYGISQLLLLPSYMYLYDQIDPMLFMKLFEEGVFDSLTTLSIRTIKELTNQIDLNLLSKLMTTHVFPNVTELIYDDNDEPFQLSLIKKECFPKLHIINYFTLIDLTNLDFLFPVNLISMIDTIRIYWIECNYDQNEEIVDYLDTLVYTHSIHIDIIDIDMYYWIYYFTHLNELLEKNLICLDHLSIDSSRYENIENLYYIEDNNQNIDSLDLIFSDNYYDGETSVERSLEIFLKSDVLKNLNKLTISFRYNLQYLTWISTLFNDNKFNTIHELEISLESIKEDSSSEYLTAYENILTKLIPKASIIRIYSNYLYIQLLCCYMTFINRLIPKGFFHNTTELILDINDIPDDNFCKLYTTDNFPQLKYIKFYKHDKKWWISFMKTIYTYINSNFPLANWEGDNNYYYSLYDPNTSIFRCKYDSYSFMNTIIGTKNIYDEEQLSKLTKCITTGKFPKLKALNFCLDDDISSEQANICKQQLKDSPFIQQNHVDYKLY
ncbi:hypothetical protein WA158_008211 [Blastocystis sp. Blastoise]